MAAKSDAPSRRRVSLREIALAAKVSVMTVSYAMRDNPEVSTGERKRIQKIAAELGYRPDPLLTHLMQHLRSQRSLKSGANLGVLTMHDANFVRRLLNGARARATHLGYNLDVIDARTSINRQNSLTRTLLARGISGVLLAPTADPASYRSLLDWTQFSAIAMTYSVVEPRVHRVVTHHFDNAVRTFALLEERGFRRIGLAMTHDMEFRANHSYSGAYFRRDSLPQKMLPILFIEDGGARNVRAWFEENQPDAVVVANAHQVRDFLRPALGPKICAHTSFVCLDYETGAEVPGIDQLFETIGSHSVDALVAQIHRNEHGIPENPTIGMVEGHWVEGPLPLQPVKVPIRSPKKQIGSKT
jgi:DNA-binding LacI/PurR family transcriptional regulator